MDVILSTMRAQVKLALDRVVWHATVDAFGSSSGVSMCEQSAHYYTVGDVVRTYTCVSYHCILTLLNITPSHPDAFLGPIAGMRKVIGMSSVPT